MVYKSGLKCSNIDWDMNPNIKKMSIEAKGLLLTIESKNVNELTDEILTSLSGFGVSKVKDLKREFRESGLFVTQKTRKGFDYYVGFDAVNFYIHRYGKVCDPTRVSKEYESYDERILREDMELNTISHNAMRREGLL